MSAPLLEVRGVTQRYGGLTALEGVDATIDAHELVGVIGPNGAGKTTLFNVLSGVVRPTAGDVRLRGRSIVGCPPHEIARAGVGRTFQNLRLLATLSVFDNVVVGAIGKTPNRPWQALRRGGADPACEEMAWQTLQRVGLAAHADETAANLSYGLRKRLEIARALAGRPELLILDEPAAGLNETETAALAGLISELHHAGTTVLLVEHDMSFVMLLCQRLIVLAFGRRIADGPPEAVRRDPAVIDAYLGREDA